MNLIIDWTWRVQCNFFIALMHGQSKQEEKTTAYNTNYQR